MSEEAVDAIGEAFFRCIKPDMQHQYQEMQHFPAIFCPKCGQIKRVAKK